jgi:hypothetical protein
MRHSFRGDEANRKRLEGFHPEDRLESRAGKETGTSVAALERA